MMQRIIRHIAGLTAIDYIVFMHSQKVAFAHFDVAYIEKKRRNHSKREQNIGRLWPV